MPVPSGLVKKKKIARRAARIGQHVFRRDHAGDSQSIDRLGIANGVPADDGATGFLRLLEPPRKDRRVIVCSETRSVGIPMMFNAVSGRPPIAKMSESALAAAI